MAHLLQAALSKEAFHPSPCTLVQALHACNFLWKHLQPAFLGLPELFETGLLS
jgi:hypothetical protein